MSMTSYHDPDVYVVQGILREYPKVVQTIRELRNVRTKLVDLCLDGHISEADFYRISSLLSPQIRSTMWESYYIKKNDAIRVYAKENYGDLIMDGIHFEFKSSCNEDGKVHIVQIRLWQMCDYIVQSILVDKFVNTFRLTHKQMENETVIINANSAHGTFKSNKINNNVELRMSFDIGSLHWNRWLNDYMISEIALNQYDQEIQNMNHYRVKDDVNL